MGDQVKKRRRSRAVGYGWVKWKAKKLGTMGSASTVRPIDPADYSPQEQIGPRPAALPLRTGRWRSRDTQAQTLENRRLLRCKQKETIHPVVGETPVVERPSSAAGKQQARRNAVDEPGPIAQDISP